jgi:radical SAM superfamily enzyme YgiQ (UPF0313 family)
MRVLLLNPPFKSEHGRFSREQRSPAITKSGTFYYPMWLCYAAGLLEQHGFEVLLIDAPASRMTNPELYHRVSEFSPQMVVVNTSTPSIGSDVGVADYLKKSTEAFTVVVGTHPSALPEETLKMAPSIDAAGRGEYEITLRELASCLQNDSNPPVEELRKIDGLSFSRHGEVHHNQDRELNNDLDSLPFVSKMYKKHLNYKEYFYAHSKHPIITTISGRGCPHRCVYCVYPQVFSGRKLRYRSISNVLDEIEYILSEFPGVKEIMFEDDTLTISNVRCQEFAEEILRRGLKVIWSANSRCDVDLKTMQLLKRAGLRLFCVGVESGVQDVLDSMNKKLKIERIRQFFVDARKAGILIHGCFLVGNPEKTKETLKKTLQFAKELNPDTAQFFPIIVYPGTEAYEWAKRNGYLTTENNEKWLTESGLHNCIVSRPGLSSSELVDFCDQARREFYLRPKYILSKGIQGLRDPYEFRRLLKGAAIISKHIFRGTFRSEQC